VNQLHVVGAGWAGLSAAIHGIESGFTVSIHEMSHHVGGRAQSVDFHGLDLDNGQHILTGACADALNLLRLVGVDPESALLRLPMRLSTPHGTHARWLGNASHSTRLWGLLTDPQMSVAERFEWLATLVSLRCADPTQWLHTSAATWLDRCAGKLVRPWLEALCVSALNLAPDKANAGIFLQVMKESFKTPQSSDLLLPRLGLSELLPNAAREWLSDHGAVFHMGQRVDHLAPLLQTGQVILACTPKEAARLTAAHAPDWSSQAKKLGSTAIATVYTQWTENPPDLPEPLIFLPWDLASPAQVVIDQGSLRPGVHPKGFWSWVVSDAQLDREGTMAGVLDQAERTWGRRPAVKACFLDPRATLACTPSLQRPGSMVGQGIWACGDYIESMLPSTLEGAVRSGKLVIEAIRAQTH
jgi:hypothetical protein